MSTCKDCKYWNVRVDRTGLHWNECGVANRIDTRVALLADEVGYYTTSAAYDDSDFVCGIKTGPDFGCVKWGAK